MSKDFRGGCQSVVCAKQMLKWKSVTYSVDLKVIRELLLRICVGNEFQTDGAEYWKECLANSVQYDHSVIIQHVSRQEKQVRDTYSSDFFNWQVLLSKFSFQLFVGLTTLQSQ